MRNFIKFYVNGEFHKVSGDKAFKPLSKFLREDLYLTGTKEVCCEGDCGACTVIAGKIENEKISYTVVNSCILYVYQADNMHIITVEGIKKGEVLNAVQKSVVENHGTQCGYCTPGVVNTLYLYFNNLPKTEIPDEKGIKKALTGNLCRCTGYDGIIKSALSVKPCDAEKINMIYPVESLEKILEKSNKTVEILNESQKYIKPVTLNETISHRTANPQAKILSGGTDIHVLANKKNHKFEVIIDVSDLQELKHTEISHDCIKLGAGVKISEAEKVIKDYFPELYSLLEYYASPQIKNIATFAGNIANASPVGDSIPFLMVMDAYIEIFGNNGKREININNFYKGYKTFDLNSDEIITGVKIPLFKENEILKLYKISKRKHLDISTFSAAFRMKIQNNIIEDFAFSLGGVAACTIRVGKIEEFINGRVLTKELFEEAAKMIKDEIKPISDVRSSGEYRINLAENILRKFYFDINQELSQ